MKIINYESYIIRTTKPLENLAGCGIKEIGIKATVKILCFTFKIKVLKMKCNENGETPSFHFEKGHIEFNDRKVCSIGPDSIAFILNNLNNKNIN